nr:hypothetical protein [Tanacetum cinerariifolium]
MENKPNVTCSGPAWLFDIDSLSKTMNYHPVIAENQSNIHPDSTNDFSAAGPSNADMPNFEDLSHDADDVESIKLSRIQVGLKPHKKSSFSSKCKKFGS